MTLSPSTLSRKLKKKCCVLFKAASREQLFPDSGRFIDTLQSLQIEAAMHRQCYCWIVSEGKRCNNRRVTQKKNSTNDILIIHQNSGVHLFI